MEKRGEIKILVLVVLAIAGLTGTCAAAPNLANSGGGVWQYYREITITEKSGSTLSDYQVLVQLSGGNFPTMRSDGADIRFTDANEKELSYWVESWNYADRTATVWIKVPSIQRNSENRISMYYGNPSASSSSNGDNTFDFFDDFSTSSLKSGWSFENPGGDDGFSLSERPGWMRIKVIGRSDIWSGDSYSAPFLRMASPSGNYVVQAIEDGTDVKLNQHSLLRYSIGSGKGDQGSGYFGTISSQTAVEFNANGYRREGPCDTQKNIHYIRFRKIGSTLLYDWSIDGINWNNCGNYILPSNPSYWGLGGKSWGDGNFNADFDNFIIRKYASPEPTIAIGAEKIVSISTTPTLTITPPLSEPTTITGTVIDARTGKPVFGATVSIGSKSDTTGSDGKYELKVIPGDYNLIVTRPEYETIMKSVNVPEGGIDNVDFFITSASIPWLIILIILFVAVIAGGGIYITKKKITKKKKLILTSCPKCGAKVVEGASFCDECGEQL